MSGYKCVQFSDLCRLCTSSTGTKIQVFSEEGNKLELNKKINDFLSVVISDRDKLPKLICSICMESVQQISEYRQSCIKAQKMLESCLNTSKLQNGGQVYIKDEPKKVLTIQNQPSAGKLQGNKISIISTNPQQLSVQTPVVLQQHQKLPKNGSGTDFLSSIMQAVGIQTSDDSPDSVTQISSTATQQTVHPQYTLTLDGQTFKTGKIQYKIENASPAARTLSIESSVSNLQQQSNSQTNEFTKLKSTQKVTNKKENQHQQNDRCSGSKSKKPKINLFVQTNHIKQPKQATPQKSIIPLLNTPNKSSIQVQDIKIIPSTSMQNNISTNLQTTPKKQYIMPIVLNNGTIGSTPVNTDTQQLFTQALQAAGNQSLTANNTNIPVAYLQMKIQQNADGQSFHLAPANMQTTLTLSPQQLQQFGFHSSTQQLIQAPLVSQQSQTTHIEEEEEEEFDEHYEDNQYVLEVEDESMDDLQVKTSEKPMSKIKSDENALSPKSLTKLQNQQQQQSETAKKQLKRMSSHSIKHQSETAQKSTESILTTCDVCQKLFKRKEHLTQHLKSHVGLRPFKCDEPLCNKSFSRKEHLIRHVVSHTGEKMFKCNYESCNKLFSRKDNLNKHRRIHPESAHAADLSCEVCGKACVNKSQLAKHQSTHIVSATAEIKKESREKSTIVVKAKTKITKKMQMKIEKPNSPQFDVDTQPKSIPPNQQFVVLDQGMFQQQKLKQDAQHSSQVMQFQLAMPIMNPQQTSLQQQHQNKELIKAINAAVSSGDNQATSGATIYSLPSNLILNSGGTFMTNTGDFE